MEILNAFLSRGLLNKVRDLDISEAKSEGIYVDKENI